MSATREEEGGKEESQIVRSRFGKPEIESAKLRQTVTSVCQFIFVIFFYLKLISVHFFHILFYIGLFVGGSYMSVVKKKNSIDNLTDVYIDERAARTIEKHLDRTQFSTFFHIFHVTSIRWLVLNCVRC